MKTKWSLNDKQKIEGICRDIAILFITENYPDDMIASALMTTLARVCVLCKENDEYIEKMNTRSGETK